jgi:hypothetical protein
VAEFCSCGAELVDQARFCHRCGKPTKELLPEEEAEAEPVTPPPPTANEIIDQVILSQQPPGDISFGNGTAVRIALMVAGISMLIFAPLANLLGLGILGILLPTLCAGVLSVFLYQRRTGATLQLMAGARLGWITGVFMFSLFLVLFTLSVIPAIEAGEFQKLPETALKDSFSAADLERVKEVMQNPGLLAGAILVMMILYFVGATTLTSLGGMLGAKLLGSNERLKG